MAKIPEFKSQITDAIYQHYQDTAKDWRRPHLGASQIGGECDRALWYQFRWCMPPEFPGRVLRLFDTGNREEERIVKDLRGIGVEIYDRNPNNPDKQIRYVDPDPECGGHFSGSLDGVARGFVCDGIANDEWAVVEMKTTNTRGYLDLYKTGVEKTKPQHYIQMQCYMAWTGRIKKAVYIAKSKEGDHLYTEVVPYNEQVAQGMTAKAKSIIFAPEPPAKCRAAGPNNFTCRYCAYQSLCFGKCLPEVNCRTCAHSSPVVMDCKGRWGCDKIGMFVDTERQKSEICDEHIFIPDLVPMDVSDADADAGTITYADGTVNGPGGLSSREMRAKYGERV